MSTSVTSSGAKSSASFMDFLTPGSKLCSTRLVPALSSQGWDVMCLSCPTLAKLVSGVKSNTTSNWWVHFLLLGDSHISWLVLTRQPTGCRQSLHACITSNTWSDKLLSVSLSIHIFPPTWHCQSLQLPGELQQRRPPSYLHTLLQTSLHSAPDPLLLPGLNTCSHVFVGDHSNCWSLHPYNSNTFLAVAS